MTASNAPRRFLTGSAGSATVELVIVLPMLLWALAATVVFFDAFKARYHTQMAAQTIADVMSRETDLFTATYVEGLNDVFDFLAGTRYPTRIRVSSVIWDSENERHRLQWSYGTRGFQPLPANTFELLQDGDYDTLLAAFGAEASTSFTSAAAQMPVAGLEQRIPPILPGEALLVVETFALWSPFASVGLAQTRLAPVVAVRPRFAPWINFQGVEPIYPESDYEIAAFGGGNTSLPDPTVTPPPTTAPTRTYSFDDGDTAGWSRTTLTSGGPSGSFLGIFGPETYATPVTLSIDLPSAGMNATIGFDLILTDSWDGYSTEWALPRGDTMTLMINGTPISMDAFSGGTGAIPYRNTRVATGYLGAATYRLTMTLQGSPSGTNFIGSSWNDHIWRATLSIENAPRNFTLGFSAGTDSPISDEGFGIDNVTINASGTGTPAAFTHNLATLSGSDVHTRFPIYVGCPEYRIAAPWLTMMGSDLSTGLRITRETGRGTSLQGCGQNGGGWGWFHASPHLILNYDNQSTGHTLRLSMNDGNNGYTCDTTLLVRDPNGQWWFNDDQVGWNAGLAIPSAVSGHYAVFIGSYGNVACTSALTINR